MSINVSQITNVISLIDGGINVVSREEVQNTGRSVKAADFVLKLGLKKGKRYTTRLCEFSCICRPNGNTGEPNLEKLFNGASIIASNIAALSKGVVFGLFMKIGKYRNDEIPDSVYNGSYNTAILQVDNVDVEYNSCGEPTSGIMPHRKVGQSIYIPFVGDDVSLQAVQQSLLQDFPAGDCIVNLGVTRFEEGSEKAVVEAYRTGHKAYARMKQLDKTEIIEYLNNDSRLGDPDYVVSEKYNSVVLPADSLPVPPDHDSGQQSGGGSGNGDNGDNGDGE